ncbi:hypothetical protein MHYP_G00072980 [Metynnis hypsauchen]
MRIICDSYGWKVPAGGENEFTYRNGADAHACRLRAWRLSGAESEGIFARLFKRGHVTRCTVGSQRLCRICAAPSA